jgi:hypothetical protein
MLYVQPTLVHTSSAMRRRQIACSYCRVSASVTHDSMHARAVQPKEWNLPDHPPPVPLALSGISPCCEEMIRRNDDRRCNRSSKNSADQPSNGVLQKDACSVRPTSRVGTPHWPTLTPCSNARLFFSCFFSLSSPFSPFAA